MSEEDARSGEMWEEDPWLAAIIVAVHEAAHAVFAYHDEEVVSEVVVCKEGAKTNLRFVEFYQRKKPWRYAQMSLAGFCADYLMRTLSEYRTPEELPLPALADYARKEPLGEIWDIVTTVAVEGLAPGSRFNSIEEAYAALMEETNELIEERWDEIEAVANELTRRFWEAEEQSQGTGILSGGEVAEIIEQVREKSK